MSSTSSTMGRSIAKIVPAKNTGKLFRLIGTLDCDGNGTEHNALPQVDPFILLDAATITQPGMPPFGPHPHRGHSVVTILLQGKLQSWDSFHPNEERLVLQAPAAYWVDAGSGVFHEETSVMMEDDEADPAHQQVKLLQLWIGVQEVDRSQPPRVQHCRDLPVLDCVDENGTVVGQQIVYVGPGSTIETPHPISIVHVTQQPGTTYQMPLTPGHGGMVVILSGGGHVALAGQAATLANEYDVVVLDNASSDHPQDFLHVTTCANNTAPMIYVVCTGERHNEPLWAKKLVANGALLCATAEQARALAPKVAIMAQNGKQQGGSFAPFGI